MYWPCRNSEFNGHEYRAKVKIYNPSPAMRRLQMSEIFLIGTINSKQTHKQHYVLCLVLHNYQKKMNYTKKFHASNYFSYKSYYTAFDVNKIICSNLKSERPVDQ